MYFIWFGLKIFLFFFQNRQFVFAPKIQYKLAAERSKAASSGLQFPYWCLYFTKLASILAKIADADEPAASRRKAAACLAEKLSLQFLICARHQKILLKRKKFFCSAPRDYARAAGFNADEAKQKLFLRGEKDFALPRLFLFSGGRSAAQEGAGGMRGGFGFRI